MITFTLSQGSIFLLGVFAVVAILMTFLLGWAVGIYMTKKMLRIPQEERISDLVCEESRQYHRR